MVDYLHNVVFLGKAFMMKPYCISGLRYVGVIYIYIHIYIYIYREREREMDIHNTKLLFNRLSFRLNCQTILKAWTFGI